MFEHHKELIERIYAPLFDELTIGRKMFLGSLERMDRTEWNRIQHEHLSHWIEPTKLKELLTEIYGELDGRLVSLAVKAMGAVVVGLDDYLRSNWRGPTTITVQTSPGVTETATYYYQSTPFHVLTGPGPGPGLFRAIALDENLHDDPTLQKAFDQLKAYVNPKVTGLDVIVEEVRQTLGENTQVKEFKALFKTCSDKIDTALKLLKGQLNP
jgi:hypothetical protein